MMKKLWNRNLAAVLVLIIILYPMTAHADVIWESQPVFWKAHRDECQYLSRSYRASGEVTVYKSPEDDKAVKILDAGTIFEGAYIYMDANGDEWVSYEGGEHGWVAKVYLETVYDHISFENEYGDRIREKSGILDEKYREEIICFWNYPGHLNEMQIDFKDFELSVQLPEYEKVFTDEQGHEWGYVSYWYGWDNFWICLDEPAAGVRGLYDEEIPERGVRTKDGVVVEKMIDPAEVETVVPAESGSNLLVNFVVTVLVVGVIIITAAILRTMKKKNNRRQS